MANPKIKTDFPGYNDSAFEVKTSTIIAAMTGNPHFPSPIPPLSDVVSASTEYSAALVAAKNGGKTEAAVKDQKREALENLLIKLAAYVTMIAGTDRAIMLGSSFDLVKERQPLPPIEKPQIIKVVNGINAGDVLMVIRRVIGARNCIYQYTPDPLTADSVWEGQNSTLSKMLLKNLESGKKYWFRVVAYGNNEQVAYSDPVSRIVQ